MIKISGSILVFLGAVFWSLNAPLIKYLVLDPYLMCGLRSSIAGLALAAFIRPRQMKWNLWTLLYTGSYCALSMTIILALKMTTSPVAIGMQYTAIIWLFLLQWGSTGKFNGRSFIPVCIILIGVALFMCSGTGGTDSMGNLIALSEGVFFAGMTVGAKKAACTNPLGLTAVGNLFTGLIILSMFPASTATVVTMGAKEWIIILILGVVQQGCGYAFYNMGVQRVTPQKASILALWEMILGPFWVAVFLHEKPASMVLLGFVIILGGMLLDALLGKTAAEEQPA